MVKYCKSWYNGFKTRCFANRYLVRINYKSGNSFTGWFYRFNINNGTFSWRVCSGQQVLMLGADHIESIFVVSARKGFFQVGD